VPESVLQQVALEAMNRLLTGRVEFLTSLEQNIAAVGTVKNLSQNG
jgi:hypothetical protein